MLLAQKGSDVSLPPHFAGASNGPTALVLGEFSPQAVFSSGEIPGAVWRKMQPGTKRY